MFHHWPKELNCGPSVKRGVGVKQYVHFDGVDCSINPHDFEGQRRGKTELKKCKLIWSVSASGLLKNVLYKIKIQPHLDQNLPII